MAKNIKKIEQYTPISKVLTVVFAMLSIVWLFPIFEVVINSFKENSFVNLNLILGFLLLRMQPALLFCCCCRELLTGY